MVLSHFGTRDQLFHGRRKGVGQEAELRWGRVSGDGAGHLLLWTGAWGAEGGQRQVAELR